MCRTFVEIERDWGRQLGTDDQLGLLRDQLDGLIRSTGSCDASDRPAGGS